MRVVSCFDGISCGQVALERAGISVSEYYAAEIDKHAIKVTQRNYPRTIQVGDVKNMVQLASSGLLGKVDLLMGGSPCQGFSNAGKGLGFTDPRSKLFFDFVTIKNYLKPRWFLLENVRMKQADQDIISFWMGCQPIKINSADFSAQNRVRLYWTNIPVAEWSDRGIVLADVLEGDWQSERDKSYCIDANYWKGISVDQYFAKSRRQIVFKQLGHGFNGGFEKALETSPTLTSNSWQHNNFVRTDKKGNLKSNDIKAGCLTAGAHSGGNHSDMDKIAFHKPIQGDKLDIYEWRRLSVVECERLQTLPDNYTAGISNTQRYKSIGNGWTVDVIAHIFRGML